MSRIVWLLAVIVLAGCGSNSDTSSGETWAEKVKLSNGEVLVVKREARFGSGDAGQGGGPLTYSSLAFEYKGKKYFWESETAVPDLVEIDDSGRPVVASSVVYEWALRKRGSPCDQDVVNVFNNGLWTQIPSWEIHVSKRRNLAPDKKRAIEGKALADILGVGGPEVKYEWNKENCEKEIENRSE